MMKIATHDSATGEKPINILSWLLIPFARTQSKTVKQQYDAGCRMFDIRIRKYKGQYHLAHGLYITKKSLSDLLHEINNFKESCYVCLTYEGKFESQEHLENFKIDILCLQEKYTHINWGPVAVKYTNNDTIVDWANIIPSKTWCRAEQGFLPLDGKHWQTYIPIPWLWKKIYFNKPVFNEEYFTFVDFL